MTRIIFILFLSLALSVPVFSQIKQAPLDKELANQFYESLKKSDNQKALDSILQTFQKFNVSWYPNLAWQYRSYKEPINQYKNGPRKIFWSEFPTRPEAPDYWDNWSKTLTDGKFNYRKFFKDEREMLLMANFNQMILAAHEFGHHLDYFYNISTYGVSGFSAEVTESPLNCTEGYADHVAVVLVNYLAQEDPRFARLRSRYLQLINEINRQIPDNARLNFTDVSMVEENCGKISYKDDMTKFDPIKNTEDFRRYVSIYFNRWNIMLTNKQFPDIDEFLEKRLFEPFYKRIKLNSEPISVKTLSAIKLPKVEEEEDKDGLYLSHSDVLNKQGEFRRFIVNAKTNDKKDWQTAEIEWQNDKFESLGKVTVKLPEKYSLPFSPTFLVIDDNEFFVFLMPDLATRFDREQNCKERFLYRFRRSNGIWEQQTAVNESKHGAPCDDYARFVMSPGGKIFLQSFKGEDSFYRLTDKNSQETTRILLTEIDRETLKAKETNVYGTFKIADFPALSDFGQGSDAITDDGRLLMSFQHSPTTEFSNINLAELKQNGEVTTLAGTVFGHADGDDKRKIKFSDILSIRPLDAKTFRVLDMNFEESIVRIREIRLQ